MAKRVLRFDGDEEWLKARRRLITASDSRGILNVGYSDESPMGVYEEKVTDEPVTVDHDNPRFLIGHLLEPVCKKLFKRETGISLKSDAKKTIRLHDKYDWLGATLDTYYHRSGQIIPVEFKGVSAYREHEWRDQVPLKVQIQVQHQIAVTGAPFGWVLAFLGVDGFHVQRVVRDQDFIDALLMRLLEFWSHVKTRVPPPANFSKACEKALVRLHPSDNGLGVVLPPESMQVAERLKLATELLKVVENEERYCKNLLRQWIGDYTYGVLPDGSGYSWKTQEWKQTVRKAGKSRVLRRVRRGNLPDDVDIIERKGDDEQRQGIEHTETRAGDDLCPNGGAGANQADSGDRGQATLPADASKETTD